MLLSAARIEGWALACWPDLCFCVFQCAEGEYNCKTQYHFWQCDDKQIFDCESLIEWPWFYLIWLRVCVTQWVFVFSFLFLWIHNISFDSYFSNMAVLLSRIFWSHLCTKSKTTSSVFIYSQWPSKWFCLCSTTTVHVILYKYNIWCVLCKIMLTRVKQKLSETEYVIKSALVS